MSDTMRIRVRPLHHAADWELAAAWSSRLCLSVPHVGEAIDFMTDEYRLKDAQPSEKNGKPTPARILHYGHELGRPCDEAEGRDAGRCLIVDYVPAAAEKSDVELEVAGLVMAGKAG